MRTGKVHFLGYAVTMQEMNPGGAHTNRGQLNQVAVTSSGSGKSGSQPKRAVPQRPCLAGRALPPSRAALVHGGIASYWTARQVLVSIPNKGCKPTPNARGKTERGSPPPEHRPTTNTVVSVTNEITMTVQMSVVIGSCTSAGDALTAWPLGIDGAMGYWESRVTSGTQRADFRKRTYRELAGARWR